MYLKNLNPRILSYIIFIIIILLFFPTISFSKIFKVKDIEISEPFNANFKKELVISKAFIKAFKELILTLSTSSDSNKFNNVKLKEVKFLVDSFTINNEKFLDKKYLANFDVNFNKSKILNFFEKKNVFPSVFKKQKFLTIIIYYDSEKDQIYLYDKNPFYLEWNNIEKKFYQLEYILPEEDLYDLKVVNQNIQNLEDFKFKEIIKKYDINEYIISIFFKNKDKIRILSKIYFNDQMKIQNQTFNNVNELDKKTVENLINYNKLLFEDIWKKNNQINTSIKLPINLSISSKKRKKVINLEQHLSQIDLVSDYKITSFDNNMINYKIIFNGTPGNFLNIMNEKQIKLNTDEQTWKVE